MNHFRNTGITEHGDQITEILFTCFRRTGLIKGIDGISQIPYLEQIRMNIEEKISDVIEVEKTFELSVEFTF